MGPYTPFRSIPICLCAYSYDPLSRISRPSLSNEGFFYLVEVSYTLAKGRVICYTYVFLLELNIIDEFSMPKSHV